MAEPSFVVRVVNLATNEEPGPIVLRIESEWMSFMLELSDVALVEYEEKTGFKKGYRIPQPSAAVIEKALELTLRPPQE